MAESWYVPAAVEFDDTLKTHIIRAGVPDAVYALPNAWDQEEVEFGRWILHFRDGILTDAHRTSMRRMGCVLVSEGKPARSPTMDDRSIAVTRSR